MKTLDRLNDLIKKRYGHTEDYQVEYQPRHDYPDVGEVYRGYYLQMRPEGYVRRPGDYGYAEFINGKWIGSNFRDAKTEILKIVPERTNEYWYQRLGEMEHQYAEAMQALSDLRHWAGRYDLDVRLDPESAENTRNLLRKYIDKADELLKGWHDDE